MSNVIHRETLNYLKSVNTPDYPETEYIINPELPNCEKKYWKIVSNEVVEMTATERRAVDDAETEALKYAPKDRQTIMAEILQQAEPTTQLPRLLDAVDNCASFILALDNMNYALARKRMSKLLADALITLEDYDLVDALLPLEESI